MESANKNGHNPKIVVIGGGSGSSNLLRGLRQHPCELSAIVTMFDSGGSSGLLRKEFGLPPFGDLRQCLLALGDGTPETRAIREALDFRFESNSSLDGHSVGNLLMAALTSLNHDLERAIDEIARMLRVKGKVIPVTLEGADLCAELEDGRVIHGESDIDLRTAPRPPIKRVFLEPDVQANPRAIQAVLEADAIVLGPGDLYTSVLPNLLPKGMTEAIAASNAMCGYICNLMTKRGETDNFRASDFVREVSGHLVTKSLDWVIVNTEVPATPILRAYQAEEANPVEADLEAVRGYAADIIGLPLTSSTLPLRHDPDLTAPAILKAIEKAIERGRLARDSQAVCSSQRQDCPTSQSQAGVQQEIPLYARRADGA